MPYIVKMIYSYPENAVFPPEPSMRFTVPEEVRKLRQTFIEQNKILSTDGHLSHDTFTGTNIVTFASYEAFSEWISVPIVMEFFKQRDEFLSTHGIGKTSEFTEV